MSTPMGPVEKYFFTATMLLLGILFGIAAVASVGGLIYWAVTNPGSAGIAGLVVIAFIAVVHLIVKKVDWEYDD